MKQLLGVALLALLSMSTTRAEETAVMTGSGPTLLQQDVEKVAPALQAYAKNRLLNDVWKRPGLAPRDRSIVTLAALIARNQTIELAHHVDLALDNGVKPREISEITTQVTGARVIAKQPIAANTSRSMGIPLTPAPKHAASVA